MFDIRIERRGHSNDALGELVIGGANEAFIAELSYWDVDDYVASWLRSTARVLERGFGRFLVSVHAPGQATFHSWACRVQGAEAVLFKSFLLPEKTVDLNNADEAERLADNDDEPSDEHPIIHRCTLTDIAAFEARLRGQAMS
jgi:hypothetical protein